MVHGRIQSRVLVITELVRSCSVIRGADRGTENVQVSDYMIAMHGCPITKE